MDAPAQIFELLILAIPVASISRTVVFEEVFREPRNWCLRRCEKSPYWIVRKFFFLFTCEYCFSHYAALFFLLIAGFHLLLSGWRGYLIGFFSLVFVANVYLNLYARLRVEISREKAVTKSLEEGNDAARNDKMKSNAP